MVNLSGYGEYSRVVVSGELDMGYWWKEVGGLFGTRGWLERIDVAGIGVMAWVDEVFPCWEVGEIC